MSALRWLTGVLDASLRGVGQVMFQNHRGTGVLFLAGLAVASPVHALATLLGSVVGTALAQLLQADRTLLRTGMFGFNGALVGLALIFFLQPTALAWACVVLAAAASSVLTAALIGLLERWKLPALTAPFVFTTLCVFLASARFGHLHTTHLMPTAGLPHAAAVEGIVSFSTLQNGVINGIAQVFFQTGLITELLFAAGLLIASRAAFCAAVAAALVGALVAWGMGAAEADIRAGLYGFNSVLVAIALASVFNRCSTKIFVWALLAAAVTPFVHAAVSAALQPLGLPALTLPFVLVTWVFLLGGRGFRALHPIPTSD